MLNSVTKAAPNQAVMLNKNNTDNTIEQKEFAQNEVHEQNLNESPQAIYGKMQATKVQGVGDKTTSERTQKFIDCMIAGALGDALGRPVERIRTPQLWDYYGENGIQDIQTVGMKGRITDDTQMTIFTADGLIKSFLQKGKDEFPNMDIIFDSYQNWYKTQTEPAPTDRTKEGYVAQIKGLYAPVGPGRTCLKSLKDGIPGSIDKPINDSGSCGGVMRVAPVGLAYSDPEMAFKVGAECAALTHSGPEAYLPAGFHAAVISNIMQGKTLDEAFDGATEILKTYKGHEKTLDLIDKARYLATTDKDPKEAIVSLGYGFNGHEAMAISTYCIFKNPTNLKDALIMAVNHSGDSDSTGSITGNILGAAIGLDTAPRSWVKTLELRKEITTIAKDLAEPEKIQNAENKYPIH